MDKANAKLMPAHEVILDRLLALVEAAGPLTAQTDKYFTNTSRIVGAVGDVEVTFAVFMRRRVVAALEPAIRLAKALVPGVKIKRFVEEGEVVPSERKLMEISGSHESACRKLKRCYCKKLAFPVCRPTMPMKCVWPCRGLRSWICMRATVRVRK